MNKLTGTIVRTESSAHMSIVDIDVAGDVFSAVVLETPQTADYLLKGGAVTLLFKETEVAIAKDLTGEISLRNRFKAVVREVIPSEILTKVVLDYKNASVVSIISTRSAQRLLLKAHDQVEWLVKTNEVSLSPGNV